MLSISPSSVEHFRRTLLAEGFSNIRFQVWKNGQVFGYVRRIRNDLDWHVRAFKDGTLESEIEPPRTTIYHLIKQPVLHDGLLAQLLRRNQIPFQQSRNTFPIKE
jgi:hypothetical protein